MGSKLYNSLYTYEEVSVRHVRKREGVLYRIGVRNAAT